MRHAAPQCHGLAPGRHPSGGVSVVVQDSRRWIIQVVELPRAHRAQEQNEKDRRQTDCDRDEEEDGVHAASARRTRCSIRHAPARTAPLDSGIRTAATRGFTNPAAAAPTATTL